jgi:hypothetical protein
VLVNEFLFDQRDAFLDIVPDDCFVSDFAFELVIDLAFCIGDDAFHHIVLLLHFSILKTLNLPEFLLLAVDTLLPVHPLLTDELSNFLLLPQQFMS